MIYKMTKELNEEQNWNDDKLETYYCHSNDYNFELLFELGHDGFEVVHSDLLGTEIILMAY